jgi:Thrombospondin type 3 repeat
MIGSMLVRLLGGRGAVLRLASIVCALALLALSFHSSSGAQQQAVVIEVNEAIGVSDAQQAVPPADLQTAESIIVGDSVAVVPPAVIDVSETIGVSDGHQVVPPAVIVVNETIGVADTLGDSDGDGVSDLADNCPNWPNPAQNLPSWPIRANDPDCDGFSTAVEQSAGTDPFAHCGVDAWPADINNNGSSDTADIALLTNDFGDSVPAEAPARHNIAPDPPPSPPNSFVDTADIARLTGVFGQSCS